MTTHQQHCKRIQKTFVQFITTSILLLSVAACGGGGGSSPDTNTGNGNNGGNNNGNGGNDTPVVKQVTLSTSQVSLASNGIMSKFTVTSEKDWQISQLPTWLTASVEQADGATNAVTVELTAQVNHLSSSRSSDIKITNADDEKTLSVTQAAFAYQMPVNTDSMRDITATEITELMGTGFNIGNSMEAVGGETAWGNPQISTDLIDAIKAAGFKSIRLPVSWSQFSDESNYTIKTDWLDRVEQVVAYALSQDLYVMLNMHWDGGWLQPTYATQNYANHRLALMWTQIANRFEKYDDKLLFAGTNEVMVTGDYGTPTLEYYTVQNSFNQTFVTTVRETGGRNAVRHLIFQGFNTNIDHTINFVTIPEDLVSNKMLLEVHFYDPYEFALKEVSNATQWGKNATDATKTAGWGDESHIDTQFSRMYNNFYQQGLGLILGEFGAFARRNVAEHEAYRHDWHRHVTQTALAQKLVPFYWDNGDVNDLGFALFNRHTAAQIEPTLIKIVTDTE